MTARRHFSVMLHQPLEAHESLVFYKSIVKQLRQSASIFNYPSASPNICHNLQIYRIWDLPLSGGICHYLAGSAISWQDLPLSGCICYYLAGFPIIPQDLQLSGSICHYMTESAIIWQHLPLYDSICHFLAAYAIFWQDLPTSASIS